MRKWGDKGDKSERTVMPTGETLSFASGETAGAEREVYRDWMEARWRFEDDRWEKRSQSADLSEAQDRLGNADSPVIRILGARHLAEIALQRLPGGPVTFTPDGFPAFAQSALALSTALAQENQTLVRAEILRSLDTLRDVARQGDQSLLYVLLEALADANRAALHLFAETLGQCAAGPSAERTLRLLPGVVAFGISEASALGTLTAITALNECRAAQERTVAIRGVINGGGSGDGTPSTTMLDTLSGRAQSLCSTREALSAVLCALLPPPPTAEEGMSEFLSWRRGRRLSLRGVFLAGAQLTGVQMPGAVLTGSYLNAAHLEGANFIAADLNDAHLAEAELFGIVLEHSDEILTKATLARADWWAANDSSWRDAQGQALRFWLMAQYPTKGTTCPSKAAPISIDSPSHIQLETAPAWGKISPSLAKLAQDAVMAPAASEEMEKEAVVSSTGTRSVASKIAELKRRSTGQTPLELLTGGETTPAKVTAVPRPRSGSTSLLPKEKEVTFSKGKVVLRDKALPKDTDVFSESDFQEVTDLLADRSPVSGEERVELRDSALPRDVVVTDDDLLEVTDLLHDN